MDIETMNNMFIAFLLIAALVSCICGFLTTRIFKDNKKGFLSLLLISGILLFTIIRWYDITSKTTFIGTIPWFFNIMGAVLAYLIYLLVAWFLLKRVYRKIV